MKAYEVSSQCQIQFFIFLFNKFNRNRFNLLLPVAAWFSNKHPNICIYYITRMGLSPNPTTFRKLCNNFPSNCIIYATIWNTCLESVYIHQRRALRISFHLFIAGSQRYFFIFVKKKILCRDLTLIVRSPLLDVGHECHDNQFRAAAIHRLPASL